MNHRLLRLASLLLACPLPPATAAAPEPAPIPRGWVLDFEFQDPQRITLQLPGEPAPRTFWYLLYTVTNNTPAEVDFYPAFEIVTDTLQRIRSERNVSPLVFEAIKARHRDLYPFLEKPTMIIGRLRIGDDNARQGVAIWPDFDPAATRFSIFVRGLSGETAEIPNPAYDPARPATRRVALPDGTTVVEPVNPPTYTLYRQLEIRYDLPGDVVTRDEAQPVRTGQRWVMR